MKRNKILYEFASFLLFAVVVNGQRVAPGVPPAQYQNVPVQQQHPGPPHYQQAPVNVAPGVAPQQYQQYHYQTQQQPQHMPVQQPPANAIHMQQHQQQIPQGQPPRHQPHNVHYEQQVLNMGNIEHEREHIKEHMPVPINPDTMSEHELQFHYFKMHDSDNNNKLDGCELIKSLIHWHEQGHKDPKNPQVQPEPKVFKDDELENLIDPILKMDDRNRDGYIDYPEFNTAQEKAAANQQKQQTGGQ